MKLRRDQPIIQLVIQVKQMPLPFHKPLLVKSLASGSQRYHLLRVRHTTASHKATRTPACSGSLDVDSELIIVIITECLTCLIRPELLLFFPIQREASIGIFCAAFLLKKASEITLGLC